MNVDAILRKKGRAVATARPDWTVMQVAEQLDAHGVGALVVSTDGRTVDGIVSERDIIRQIARNGVNVLEWPVAQIMISDVVTAQRNDEIADLMAVMTERRVRHLPVVEDGRLVGIVSIGDAVKHRIEEAEFEAQAMRNYIVAG
jgi:signal-transduction protein with cAMP-binding, CBS, and nucleotidyltransferase domain